MAVELGKNLLSFLGGVKSPQPQAPVSVKPQAYKTAGYAAIPYEKAPKVTDTVPTTDKNGNPLLADYVTPKQVWVA